MKIILFILSLLLFFVLPFVSYAQTEADVFISGYLYDMDTGETLSLTPSFQFLKHFDNKLPLEAGFNILENGENNGFYKLGITSPDGNYSVAVENPMWYESENFQCYYNYDCVEGDYDPFHSNRKIEVPLGEGVYQGSSELDESGTKVKDRSCYNTTNHYSYHLTKESQDLTYYNIPMKCQEKVAYAVEITSDKAAGRGGEEVNFNVKVKNVSDEPLIRDDTKEVEVVCSMYDAIEYKDSSIEPTSVEQKEKRYGKETEMIWEGQNIDNNIDINFKGEVQEETHMSGEYPSMVSCYLLGDFSNTNINNAQLGFKVKANFISTQYIFPAIFGVIALVFIGFSIWRVKRLAGLKSSYNLDNVKREQPKPNGMNTSFFPNTARTDIRVLSIFRTYGSYIFLILFFSLWADGFLAAFEIMVLGKFLSFFTENNLGYIFLGNILFMISLGMFILVWKFNKLKKRLAVTEYKFYEDKLNVYEEHREVRTIFYKDVVEVAYNSSWKQQKNRLGTLSVDTLENLKKNNRYKSKNKNRKYALNIIELKSAIHWYDWLAKVISERDALGTEIQLIGEYSENKESTSQQRPSSKIMAGQSIIKFLSSLVGAGDEKIYFYEDKIVRRSGRGDTVFLYYKNVTKVTLYKEKWTEGSNYLTLMIQYPGFFMPPVYIQGNPKCQEWYDFLTKKVKNAKIVNR